MPSGREVLAFKAGTWAGLPLNYLIEKYGIPYVKQRLGERAFYKKINSMPSRRLTAHKAAGTTSYLKHKKSSSVYAPKYKKNYMIGVPELKTHTTQLNSGSLTTHNTQDALLYNMNQGVEAGQRIAKEIQARRINFNLFARNLGNANSIYLRVLVIADKKAQIGATNTNLFRSKGEAYEPIDFGVSSSMDTIRNPINLDRYTVYSDRKFKLAANIAGNNGDQNAIIKYSVNINRKIRYLADTVGVSSDKVTPNIWVKYWIERDDGAAVASQGNVSMDIYQEFLG